MATGYFHSSLWNSKEKLQVHYWTSVWVPGNLAVPLPSRFQGTRGRPWHNRSRTCRRRPRHAFEAPVGQVNLGLLQWACLGQWRSCLTRTGCVQIPWDRLGVCGSFGPEPQLLWDVLLSTAKEGGESLILPSSLLLSPHCPCSQLETLGLLLQGHHSLIRFPKIQWVPSHQHNSCLL